MAWTPELLSYYGKPPYQPENPDGWNIPLRPYADAVRAIAADDDVLLVDVDELFRAYASAPGHHIDDLLLNGMHPNTEGHRLIAEGILARLK